MRVPTLLTPKIRNLKLQDGKVDDRQREEIFELIQNKSRRQCDLEFVKLRPETAKMREVSGTISEDLTQIQFVATQKLMEKLNELRDRLGNRNVSGYGNLIESIADIALKQLKKAKPAVLEPAPGKTSEIAGAVTDEPTGCAVQISLTTLSAKVKKPVRSKPSRYIKKSVQAAVWQRDGRNLFRHYENKSLRI